MNLASIISSLDKLEQRRSGIITLSIASRFFYLLTLITFFMLFFGFIESFMGSNEDVVFRYFKWFFYFVPAIILFMLIYNLLEGFLKLTDTFTLNRKTKLIMVLVLTVFSIIMAGEIGTLWLGRDINVQLFIKWLASILTMIVLALIAFLLSLKEKVFIEDYKTTLIPQIVNALSENVRFEPKGMINKDLFLSSELFPAESITSYYGNFLIEGNYGKGSFQFSQLEVKEKRTTHSQGKTSTTVRELFKGLFYVADFNKHFQGITVVLPDHPRKLFGELLGEKINGLPKFGNTSIVRLENPDFEKEFAVYSNDQIEARYILSPALMERLLNLQKRLKQDFYISFFDNKMFLAIASAYDVYAPFLFKPVNTEAQVKPIIDLISGLIDTPKELDLNTRIWSKE